MKHAVVALLIAHLVSLGCGGSDPPTQPTPRTREFESTYAGEMPGQSSQCFDFDQGAAGPVTAHVGLRVPLEVGTGRCSGTRTVVARSDSGEVTATLPGGNSFFRVENPGDGRLTYQVLLRYTIVY